jgi:hypothetical protein
VVSLDAHHSPKKTETYHHYYPLSQPQFRNPALGGLSSNTIEALEGLMILIIWSQFLIQATLNIVNRVRCTEKVAVIFCVRAAEGLDNIDVAVTACVEDR